MQGHLRVRDEGFGSVARHGGFDLRLAGRHDTRVEVHLGGEAQGVLAQTGENPGKTLGKPMKIYESIEN